MDYKKYSKKVLIVGIANVFMYTRNFLVLPILARSLGVGLYGLWSQIYALVELLTPIFSLRLSAALTRNVAAENDPQIIRDGFWTTLISGIISSCILSLVFLFFITVSTKYFGQEMQELTRFAPHIAIMLILSGISNSCLIYFKTFERSSIFSFLMLTESLGFIILTFLLLNFGLNVLSPVYGIIITKFIIILFSFPIIIKEIGVSFVNKKVLAEYLSYSIPLIPMGLLYWTVQMSDRYMIDLFLNKEEVGRYSAAYAVGGLISFIYSPIFTFLLPRTAILWEKEDFSELKKFFRMSLKYPTIVALPMVITGPVWGVASITLVLGGEFATSTILILNVLLGYFILMVGTFYTSILHMEKRTTVLLSVNIVSAFLNVSLNLILIPLIGIEGAAFSTCLTFLVQTLLFHYFTKKSFEFDLGGGDIFKVLLSSIVYLIILLNFEMNRISELTIALLGGGVIYFLLLILLRVLKKEELKFLYSMVK